MHWLRSQLTRTPLVARAVPFVLFVLLTSTQGWFGPAGRYWVYALKTGLGAVMIVAIWPAIAEMRWKWTWEGVGVGVAVFVMWVGLDPFLVWCGWAGSYPKMDLGGPWNPPAQFGSGSALSWFFIAVRIAGSTVVVSALEETFYRSFLYRFAQNSDFLSVPLRGWLWRSFLFASAVFASAHREWLAALLCGFAYQGLVCWKGRLGDAMTAHAVTNCLLGFWVVWREEWQFW